MFTTVCILDPCGKYASLTIFIFSVVVKTEGAVTPTLPGLCQLIEAMDATHQTL
jgi:hypothetical protein